MFDKTGPCGKQLDEFYTCTRETTDGQHIGQHHDEVNDVQWRDEVGTWLVSLGSCSPRTTMLTE